MKLKIYEKKRGNHGKGIKSVSITKNHSNFSPQLALDLKLKDTPFLSYHEDEDEPGAWYVSFSNKAGVNTYSMREQGQRGGMVSSISPAKSDKTFKMGVYDLLTPIKFGDLTLYKLHLIFEKQGKEEEEDVNED